MELDKLSDFPQMFQSLQNISVEETNPINYINKNSAPMLIMHGTEDKIVPPEQSEKLFQALKNAKIEAERYLVPNAGHGDDYWQQDEIFDVIINFLKNFL